MGVGVSSLPPSIRLEMCPSSIYLASPLTRQEHVKKPLPEVSCVKPHWELVQTVQNRRGSNSGHPGLCVAMCGTLRFFCTVRMLNAFYVHELTSCHCAHAKRGLHAYVGAPKHFLSVSLSPPHAAITITPVEHLSLSL